VDELIPGKNAPILGTICPHIVPRMTSWCPWDEVIFGKDEWRHRFRGSRRLVVFLLPWALATVQNPTVQENQAPQPDHAYPNRMRREWLQMRGEAELAAIRGSFFSFALVWRPSHLALGLVRHPWSGVFPRIL